jgi:ketosteroid isomerase-like protein
MRYLTLGAIMCLYASVGSSLLAQTTDPQLMAPIKTFMEAFNKGDVPGAAATHASDADLVIIDEVPPFLWRGPKAFTSWAADLEREDKKQSITDEQVSIGAATRVETDGTWAYVIVPSVYTFKQKGTPMREAAQMTFTLRKGPGGWLIHGWTWTGPRARKVATGQTRMK